MTGEGKAVASGRYLDVPATTPVACVDRVGSPSVAVHRSVTVVVEQLEPTSIGPSTDLDVGE